MWDLDTLRYLNQQAWLSSRRMIDGETDRQATMVSPEPVFPLSILARKLTIGPPSLIRLRDLIQNYDSVVEFLRMIREFLPECEGEIMAQGEDSDRIITFARHFESKYFPLDRPWEAFEDFDLPDFVQYIPVELNAFSSETFHEFMDYREGFALLLAIVESPFVEGDERVSLLDYVETLVGSKLAGLIPAGGWGGEQLHKMLDGTKYEACAVFSDWVHGETGCWQLDADYENYEPESWNRYAVDGLTEQYPRMVELQDKMLNMYGWLEEDQYNNFAKLIAAILDVKEVVPLIPKEQMELPLLDVSADE